ncbi:ComEC/Rec2 family competence protein, partial [Salmonella enterica]|uniref:ComEC/Rec2 family competence protein n=1 Tax=Salmonella enterica TaxID=28901 RepID=UPI0022BFFCEA|nr:hypothetical protein [Salmonella enterica]
PLRADVALVPHHGSAGSSDPAFVAAVRPRLALLSTGFGNRFRHPRPDVVARWRATGAATWDTAREGAVRVRVGADGVAASGERRRAPR